MRSERESRHAKAAACPAINTVTRGGDTDNLASAAPPIQPHDQRDAFSLREFADRHGISISHLFEMLKDGRGPITMRVGRRRLVSVEAAAAWRREMEAVR